MTTPIMPGLGAVDTTSAVAPQSTTPSEAESATIAAEFRTALSAALGTTIRSRRVRAEGSPEVVVTPAKGREPRGATTRTFTAPVFAALAPAGPDVMAAPKDGDLLSDAFVDMPLGAPASESTLLAEGEPVNTEEPAGRSTDEGSREQREPGAPVTVTAPTPVIAGAAAQGAPAPIAAPASRESGDTGAVTTPAIHPDARDVTASTASLLNRLDARAVVRDRSLLQPEFDNRLGRVLERMQSEFGYTVEVVETHRTQERQDTLFAQGRTAPGPVVTWTRNSNHSEGLAADVTVNGGWSDRAGFERLARVAKEEGLHTLWPRDPGHIELAAQPVEARRVPAPMPVGVPREAMTLPMTPGEIRTLPMPDESMRTLPVRDGVARTLPVAPGEVTTMPMPRAGEERRASEARLRALAESLLPQDGAQTLGEPRLTDNTDVDLVRDVTPRPLMAGDRTREPAAARGVATVARVAEVATVASVAAVAQVARPGSGVTRPADTESPKRREQVGRRTPVDELSNVLTALVRGSDDRPELASREISTTTTSRPVATHVAATSRAPGESSEQSLAVFERELETAAAPELVADTMIERPTTPFAPEAGEQRGETRAQGMDAVTRTDATERIARALKLQDAQADLPVSSMTLRLDHPEGGEDRIRIDLRGSTIGTRLDIADPVAAEHVRLHTSELQQALESRGLDGDGIAVRSMARVAEPNVTAAAVASGERDGLRTANAQNTSTGSQGQSRDQRQHSRSDDTMREHHHPSSRQQRDPRGNRR